MDPKDAREAATRAIDQARDHAQGQAQRAADAAKPYVERISTSAQHAADRAAGMARRAGDQFEQRGAQLRRAQDQALTEARTYTREHPMSVVGVAIAAGVLIGWLLRRR